jgi:Ran GTPase-activating protein (RanGAP) involved in mRNA processing and transport
MKPIFFAIGSWMLLAMLPGGALADSPAPHLCDKTEALCNPADEGAAIRLLDRSGIARSYVYDLHLGTPVIVSLELKANAGDDELLIRALQRLPYLKRVHAQGAGVRGLTRLRQVEHLQIVAATLGKLETEALAEMPRLYELTFVNCNFAERDALKGIVQARRLHALAFVNCNGVTDDAVKNLGRLKSLTELRLSRTAVGDAALAEISSLPRLGELDLHETPVTNAGLEKLAQSKSLRELRLSHTKVGDDGVIELARLKGLRRLNLCETKVTDASMAALAELPELQILDVHDTAITNAGLEKLARSKSLRELWLSGTMVDDEGVASLARFTSLRFLHVHSCKKMTAAGYRQLKAALPDCEIVSPSDED